MTRVLTTFLARGMHHGLAITGLALVVAGIVAFLPAAQSGSTHEGADTLASQSGASSLGAVRNIFTSSAEAATTGIAVTPQAPATVLAPTLTSTAAGGDGTSASVAPPPSGPAIAATSTMAQRSNVPSQTANEPSRVYSSALTSIEWALAESPWPSDLWPTVERIVQCESNGNAAAVGPGGYQGLMQVDPRLHGPVPPDAVGQLTQAYGVYLRQGWSAWGCY